MSSKEINQKPPIVPGRTSASPQVAGLLEMLDPHAKERNTNNDISLEKMMQSLED